MRINKRIGLLISETIYNNVLMLLESSNRMYNKSETIHVGVFTNCRECGYTYMCMAENGKTFTFCTYEHRNSDAIIINGKEGHISFNGDLPYCADNKYTNLSEYAYGEYLLTAQKLLKLIENFFDKNKNKVNNIECKEYKVKLTPYTKEVIVLANNEVEARKKAKTIPKASEFCKGFEYLENYKNYNKKIFRKLKKL